MSMYDDLIKLAEVVGITGVVLLAIAFGLCAIILLVFKKDVVYACIDSVNMNLRKIINETLDSRDFVKRDSPRKLNEEGEKILSKSGILEEIKEGEYQQLIEKLKKSDLTSKYDVVELATVCLSEMLGNKKNIQDIAYNNGISTSALLFIYVLSKKDEIIRDLKIK